MTTLRRVAGLEYISPSIPVGLLTTVADKDGTPAPGVLRPEAEAVTTSTGVRGNARAANETGGKGHSAGSNIPSADIGEGDCPRGNEPEVGCDGTHGIVDVVGGNRGDGRDTSMLDAPTLNNENADSRVGGQPHPDTAVSHGAEAKQTVVAQDLSPGGVAPGLLSLAEVVTTKLIPGSGAGGRGTGASFAVPATRSRATGIMTVAGRVRREEVRRRAELYKVFPMAAEWGALSLATLLNHGLLEKRGEIGSISTEATASAVLKQTLEVWYSRGD